MRQKSSQCWVPIQANHFMPTSPFTPPRIATAMLPQIPAAMPLLPSTSSSVIPSSEFVYPSSDGLLSLPPPVITTTSLEKRKLFRNSFRRNRESKSQVKFQKTVKEVVYDSLPQGPI